MRKRFPLIALVTVLVACKDDVVTPPAPDIQPVLTFADEEEVGSSTLNRGANGISFSIETTELEPQTAATIWVVVFNAPQHCATSPCGDPDLFVPNVMADVLYGTGDVIDGSGNTTFVGSRGLQDGTGSLLGALGLPSPGILDINKAEIHFVVRSHGPLVPGLENEMLETFNGGCQHPGPDFPDPLPTELGAPGPNTCVDVQFAVHQP